jgi:hypothetical protein
MNFQTETPISKQKNTLFILQAFIYIGYVFVRVATVLSILHTPRELADTKIYLRISTQPILAPGFFSVNRPFVFPLLLQIVHQNFFIASIIQLAITLLAWGALAFFVSISLRPAWLRIFSYLVILGVGLVRHLAGWDLVIMTESLSLSIFAMLIASGIWLLRGWQIHKVIILCVIAFFFAFTRDTNAYLLLMFAGISLVAVILRWMDSRALILAALFGLIFFLSNLSANISQRWFFPLVNVVGKRILPYTASVQKFEACGMPVTPQLLNLADSFANGNEKAFFTDPALDDFRLWVADHGKYCYVRWLVTTPLSRMREAFSKFDELIYFENVNFYFPKRYQDLLPSRIERILYPVYFLQWLWVGLSAVALIAIVGHVWRDNPLWIAFIMLCLTIFPHLFITWHGDAMAPERHAVSVGMQLSLTMWLFVFLMLERVRYPFYGKQTG